MAWHYRLHHAFCAVFGSKSRDISKLEATGVHHRPLTVRNMQARLGDVIGRLKVVAERPDDDVIDNDLILVWGSQRRIITGSDLLGRLLRGIATVETGNAAHQSGVL